MSTGQSGRGFPYGVRPEDFRDKPDWVTQFIQSGGYELMKACDPSSSISRSRLNKGLRKVFSFIRRDCRRFSESKTDGGSGGDDDD